MDTQKIDQLTDQVWDAKSKLLQAENKLLKAKWARNEALQKAGYQLVYNATDNLLIWCHPDYVDIIKASINERGFKDDIWIENKGITLPGYATHSYMA